ncbi:MAG: hypothetical protein WCO77_10205 [bacterium]
MRVIQTKSGMIKIMEGQYKLTALLATLLLTTFVATLFSLPLLGLVIRRQTSSLADWLIAVTLFLFSVGGLVLFGKVALRSFCPWHVEVENTGRNIRIARRLFGIPIIREINCNAVLILKPSYQRGDWGYQIWIKAVQGRECLVVKPHLESSDILQAKQAGRDVLNLLSTFLRIGVEEVSWDLSIAVASRGHHADDN